MLVLLVSVVFFVVWFHCNHTAAIIVGRAARQIPRIPVRQLFDNCELNMYDKCGKGLWNKYNVTPEYLV